MDLKTYLSNNPKGTAASLARYCQVQQCQVAQWRAGHSRPSHSHILQIVSFTNGEVTAHDLNPEKYAPTDNPKEVKLQIGIAKCGKPRYNHHTVYEP